MLACAWLLPVEALPRQQCAGTPCWPTPKARQLQQSPLTGTPLATPARRRAPSRTAGFGAGPAPGGQVQHQQLAQRPPQHVLATKDEQLAAHQAALWVGCVAGRQVCRGQLGRQACSHPGKAKQDPAPPPGWPFSHRMDSSSKQSSRAKLHLGAVARRLTSRAGAHRVAAARLGQLLPLLCRALHRRPGAGVGIQQTHRHLRQRILGLQGRCRRGAGQGLVVALGQGQAEPAGGIRLLLCCLG